MIDELEIEAPKFLADIFESVAGAIYLDSNCSLDTVWKAYYPILQPYLELFKKNPPQSPIIALRRLKPNAIIENSKVTETDENGNIIYEINVDGVTFEGHSANKSQAKLKAYKKAVRSFDPEGHMLFF